MRPIICALTIGCVNIIHDDMQLKQCQNCHTIREMEAYEMTRTAL